MLLKEEFASNMSYLEPSINAMIVAGEGNEILVQANISRFSLLKTYLFFCSVFNFIISFSLSIDLMTNKALQEVLYMIICAGNFLNSVSQDSGLISNIVSLLSSTDDSLAC